jgi:hypothetical protein
MKTIIGNFQDYSTKHRCNSSSAGKRQPVQSHCRHQLLELRLEAPQYLLSPQICQQIRTMATKEFNSQNNFSMYLESPPHTQQLHPWEANRALHTISLTLAPLEIFEAQVRFCLVGGHTMTCGIPPWVSFPIMLDKLPQTFSSPIKYG